VLDDSVAEHAVWLMGALARNMAPSDAAIKAGLWEPHNGRELAGKMLLVIGCGRIGSKMAWIAHFGFGMHVIGYDSANLNKQNALKAGFDEIADDLALALGKADVVSLHIPSLPETKHFVNAHFLSSMKKSAFLINTARGPIIDEVALFNALATNSIAGAGLDVFGQEPYSPAEVQKDLRTLANTVLTPHIGSSTKEACDRMAASVIKNVRAAIQGHYSELDLINPEVLKGL
jgi:phosphoglycerate dehydrogenase-like enzyme